MMYQDEKKTCAPVPTVSKRTADKGAKLAKLEREIDYQFNQTEREQLMRVPATLINVLAERVRLVKDRIRVSSGDGV